MTANESMVSEIIEMGLGFDIPDIQNALILTGNSSAADALDYLLNAGAVGGAGAGSGSATGSANKESDTMNQLKNELQKVKITNVSEKTMREALSKNSDNIKKAVEFIVKQQQPAISSSSSSQPRRQSQALPVSSSPSQQPVSTTQGQQRSSIKRTSIGDNKGLMSSAATSTSTSSITPVTTTAIIHSREDAERMKSKLLQEAELKRKQQQQEQKERELMLKKQEEEYLIEEKKKEQQKIENQKKVVENRNRIAAKKKQSETERKQKLLEWHKKHEKYDAADKAVHEEMTQNRSKAEQHLDTPEKAVQCLFERYGEDLARESLWMIQKILQNIAANPNEPKYRRFNLDNRKIHTRIETPLGAMRFLEFVGFTVAQEQPSSEPLSTTEKPARYAVLDDKQFDSAKIQQALKLLDKYLTTKETLVAPILRKMEQEMNTSEKDAMQIGLSAEELHCAVITVHDIIRNLTISPTSEHLRYVNIDDPVFRQRVGKFEQMIKMMEEIGYKLKDSPRGRHLVYEFDNNCGVPITSSAHPQIRFLHEAVNDLANAAKRILPQTAIGVGVANLRKTHSGDPSKQANLEKVLSLLEKALERIIEQPLDMTYQNISLDKIKTKYPDVTGVMSLLKLLGFDRSHKNELTKSDQYKQVQNIEKIYQLNINDFDLLRLRRDMLVQLIHTK